MLWVFKAQYDADGNGVVDTSITNIQTVVVNGGRRALVDNFTAGRATIRARYPNGFNTPLSNLSPGRVIVITCEDASNSATKFTAFYGRITDVSVEYGIPYASNVGVEDYLTITAETTFGLLARTNGNNYSMAAGTLTTQLATEFTQNGVDVFQQDLPNYNLQATTISGTWADWVNKVAASFAARIVDGQNVGIVSPYYKSNFTAYQFSDVAGANNIRYDQIEYDSLSQNYYTQVRVEPDGLTAQTASDGSAPYRTYVIDTLNANTTDALNLAQFLLATFKTPQFGISQISVNMNDPTAVGINSLFGFVLAFGAWPTAVPVSVTFRGTTKTFIIEGGMLSGTPGQTRITFYVSDATLNNAFVLNNAVFGKLDSNRLGW